MIPQKQLTLADIFEDCQDIFESDKPQFLTLLETHIDLDSIIPISFRNRFYTSTGRTCKYSLHALLHRIFNRNRFLCSFSVADIQLLWCSLAHRTHIIDYNF